jgi:transposase-like protein
MGNYTTEEAVESRLNWQRLEEFARMEVQKFLQRILEEEVTERLGRGRSQRKSSVDCSEGYRNGLGAPRKLSMTSGTITLRRPRVRGLSERFESVLLPLFKRRTEEVGKLLPELYLHGLSLGDFDLALRGLLGDGAPLSTGSIERLKACWKAEYEAWKSRSLLELDAVYMWVDGVYVKAGLEKEKAALLVAVAALRDGSKVVLAVESGHRESVESWSAILRDLKRRGMNPPRLVVGDGHLGIWGALTNVFPDVREQRCWNHRIVNVMDKLPKKRQAEARSLLTSIPYSATREEAIDAKATFRRWCDKNGCAGAGELLEKDWERMVAFYDFPKEHWRHLRTTNMVESPFATVRLRTTASKRYKKAENATAVIWKTLMTAQKSFRKLNAPELLVDVANGAIYVDGVRVKKVELENAA